MAAVAQAEPLPGYALAPAIPVAHERGNVARLAVAQALAGANSTVLDATGAAVGNMLAPNKGVASRRRAVVG